MIGTVTVRVSAEHPTVPLSAAAVFKGSAASVRIEGVPSAREGVAVTAVSFTAVNPAGVTLTKAAVHQDSGAWTVTIPGTHFAAAGSSKAGIFVTASGKDEDGTARSWILGAGALVVLPTDSSVVNLGEYVNLRYLTAMPATPNKGDFVKVGQVYKLYNGTTWEELGGAGGGSTVTVADIPGGSTVTVVNGSETKAVTVANANSIKEMAKSVALPLTGGSVTGETSFLDGVKLIGSKALQIFASAATKIGEIIINATSGRLAWKDANNSTHDLAYKSEIPDVSGFATKVQAAYPFTNVADGDTLTDRSINVATDGGDFTFPASTGVVRDFILTLNTTTAPATAFITGDNTIIEDGDDVWTPESGKINVWFFTEQAPGMFSAARRAFTMAD